VTDAVLVALIATVPTTLAVGATIYGQRFIRGDVKVVHELVNSDKTEGLELQLVLAKAALSSMRRDPNAGADAASMEDTVRRIELVLRNREWTARDVDRRGL
jgi:hypothetical protein